MKRPASRWSTKFVLFALVTSGILAYAASEVPTFHKQVEPILQDKCQSCHRPGDVGPMSLLTYEQARPWAKAIAAAVKLKKMPPWFADDSDVHYLNNTSLSPAQIETISAWAENGAPAGDVADAPPARTFPTDWYIGKPDAVFEMGEDFAVPARGDINYKYIIFPTNYKEDRWIEAIEVRPGNRAAVHHATVFVRNADSKWMKDTPPYKVFEADEGAKGAPHPTYLQPWSPARPAHAVRENYGRLLPAGAALVLQVHYATNGKPATDRSKVGVIFRKSAPAYRLADISASTNDINLPPNASDYRLDASVVLEGPATLMRLQPHMHLRGKTFEERLVFPDGTKKILVHVSRWDPGWQQEYELAEPIALPKGTRLEATAWYDNSSNNPFNPDPNKMIHYGPQTTDEMMIGHFEVAVESNRNPYALVKHPGKVGPE